jgi:ATP-dependent RNA helicase MSS116
MMLLHAAQVMCFFTTARITQFYCALFGALGIPVLEMHSRKSQAQRTRAADQFRSGKRCIMFSSDVSARGVDYPDVSLVIQVCTCVRQHVLCMCNPCL